MKYDLLGPKNPDVLVKILRITGVLPTPVEETTAVAPFEMGQLKVPSAPPATYTATFTNPTDVEIEIEISPESVGRVENTYHWVPD
jgi:hypothetical protein